MDENIMNYFSMKLLQNPRREINEKGEIIEIYDQPERLNPMDARNSVCDSLNSMET